MKFAQLEKSLRHPPGGDIFAENYTRYLNSACKEIGENPDPENIQPCKAWVLYRKLVKLQLFKEEELERLNFKQLKNLYNICQPSI